MDELVPIIVNDTVELNFQNWCYTHKRNCYRGAEKVSHDPNVLHLGTLGSPCVVP